MSIVVIVILVFYGFQGFLDVYQIGWIETAFLMAAIVGIAPFIEYISASHSAKVYSSRQDTRLHIATMAIFICVSFIIFLLLKPSLTPKIGLRADADAIIFAMAAVYAVPVLAIASIIADRYFDLYGRLLDWLDGPQGSGGGGGWEPEAQQQIDDDELEAVATFDPERFKPEPMPEPVPQVVPNPAPRVSPEQGPQGQTVH